MKKATLKLHVRVPVVKVNDESVLWPDFLRSIVVCFSIAKAN